MGGAGSGVGGAGGGGSQMFFLCNCIFFIMFDNLWRKYRKHLCHYFGVK